MIDPSGERRSSGFFFDVNLVLITTVAASGCSFLYAVLVARALGPDGRGITVLYQASVNMVYTFFSFGISTALLYFIARRELSLKAAMRAGISVTFVATLLTAIGVLALTVTAGPGLQDRGVPYYLALVAIPCVIQTWVLEAILRAQGRFAVMNILVLLVPASMVVAVVIIELVWQLTVTRAVVIWSLAFTMPMAVGYALVGRQNWDFRPAGPAELWKLIRFGVQGQLGNLIQLLNYRLDSYLVLLFVNSAGVGLYAVGVSLSEGLWLIANSVALVLQSSLTASDDEAAARMTPIVCRNTLLITGVAALAAAAVSPLVVPQLFGRAFNDAVTPFLWLLPGTVALSANKVLAAYIFSRGKPMINAMISGATLVVTVGLDLILIPEFGIAGAAIGASFAYCLSLLLSAMAFRQLSGRPIIEALTPRLSDLSFYEGGLRRAAAVIRGKPG